MLSRPAGRGGQCGQVRARFVRHEGHAACAAPAVRVAGQRCAQRAVPPQARGCGPPGRAACVCVLCVRVCVCACGARECQAARHRSHGPSLAKHARTQAGGRRCPARRNLAVRSWQNAEQAASSRRRLTAEQHDHALQAHAGAAMGGRAIPAAGGAGRRTVETAGPNTEAGREGGIAGAQGRAPLARAGKPFFLERFRRTWHTRVTVQSPSRLLT